MRGIGFLASCLLLISSAHAAGLDSTFGTGGRSFPYGVTGASAQANGAILQSDGKIVVVGNEPATTDPKLSGIAPPSASDPSRDFLVMRLNNDGSMDTGFGSGGVVRIDFNQNDDRAQAVVQQSDGKLVVVGSATSTHGDFDLAAVRLLPDGSMDTTFGTAGKVTVNIPADPNVTNPVGGFSYVTDYLADSGYSVAIQSDGRLLIGGGSQQCILGNCPTLTRLTASGAIDATFGPTNSGTFVVQSALGSAYAIVIEPNGSVLVTTALGPVQVDADGKSLLYPVAGFFGAGQAVYSMALQSDGQILFAGEKTVSQSNVSPSFRWMVGRVQSTDVADATFGTSGFAVGGDGPYEGYVSSLLLDPSGKSLSAGLLSSGPDSLSRQDAMLLRLQSDGTPDVNFGQNGVLLTNFSDAQTEYSYQQAALLRQSDGKLLMIGNRSGLTLLQPNFAVLKADTEQIAIARFNSTPEYSVASTPAMVSNTDASISLQVTRSGATSASVSVNYATSDGTAVAGTDYTATSGTLTWSPGDADAKTISIPIANNGVSSGSRTFTVALSSPTDGSIDNASTQVTISDNAPPPAMTQPPPTTGSKPGASESADGSGGSGGGAVDWWVLAMLGSAIFGKRRNRPGDVTAVLTRDVSI